jgi:L-aspartate oxidase
MASGTAPDGTIDSDVLVIGAGIAGLCAALAATPRRVILLCPDEPVRASSSALAQGGIAAPVGPGDSIESHVGDTLDAACHSADPETVRRVVGGAIEAIAFLETSGVAFDRDGAGRSLHLEAGHHYARVAHAAGDRSGEAIVTALWQRMQSAPHIELRIGWRATELLVAASGEAAGALVVDPHGRPRVIHACATVLATGGLGGLFRCTTNGEHATGDGLAMALAIGARTAALEFIQFHPTALRVDADPLPLLTEALRGAGAQLVTGSGVPVMAGRHVFGDLAPRDVVARAVWEHAQAGENVLLDATAVFRSTQGAAFPGARAMAQRFGLDPALNPLPVSAAAHYHMGGVLVDTAGRTSIPGLSACGEVAYTGLHGANRLASNSLLEAVVCGQVVGKAIAARRSRLRRVVQPQEGDTSTATSIAARWDHMRDRLWQAMGPVRDACTLESALTATAAERDSLELGSRILRNRYGLAIEMLTAALAREESRGAHWRADFPQRDARRDGPRAVYSRYPAPTVAATHDTYQREPRRVHAINH